MRDLPLRCIAVSLQAALLAERLRAQAKISEWLEHLQPEEQHCCFQTPRSRHPFVLSLSARVLLSVSMLLAARKWQAGEPSKRRLPQQQQQMQEQRRRLLACERQRRYSLP
jgi:hypothetical protein